MLEVVELFCGAGGMSLGLRQAGLKPRLGIDLNPHCIATYGRNFGSSVGKVADVADLSARDLLSRVRCRDELVLAGCPPCQPFSKLHRRQPTQVPVFDHYLRLIWGVRPKWIVFENVPRIRLWESLWQSLMERLNRLGFEVSVSLVDAAQFGVPQRRQRLILVAARDGFSLRWPQEPTIQTVRTAIGSLPEEDPAIPNHVSMSLSADNLERIRRTQPDGGISRSRTSSFYDSYGRMAWDDVAPTITTKCISFSNGRFGHPQFDRAITVREAAILQGFPMNFVFEGPLKETARQVGNAVPPPVARWIGREIRRQASLSG